LDNQDIIAKNEIRKIEDKISLKIACHNINGLKGNRDKMETMIDRIENENYDIIGIVETNITDKEGCHIVNQRDNISGFWTSAEECKKKGSGVGAIINKK
jgi:exonuclease III